MSTPATPPPTTSGCARDEVISAFAGLSVAADNDDFVDDWCDPYDRAYRRNESAPENGPCQL